MVTARVLREISGPDGWRTPAGALALGLFALTVLLGVAVVKFGVASVPVRLVPLALCAGVLLLARPEHVGEALRLSRTSLILIAGVATLALIVSLANGQSGAVIGRQLVELHAQAAFGLVTVCALALCVGARPVLVVFLGVFALTFMLALLQFAGLEAAWDVRAALGAIMRDPPLTRAAYAGHERALGLSYSPVHFALQSCLALAAALLLRASRHDVFARTDWVLLAVVGALCLGCVATGNRSPLLGLLLFVGLYLGVRAPKRIVIIAPLMLLAVLAVGPVLDLLSDTGMRVASTEDGSAAGRSTLRAYGLHLIGLRPFGWGLGFDSVKYWATFMSEARYMENPLSIRQWALHNYYLMVLCKHGLLLLFAVPFLIPRTRWGVLLWMGFVPYAVHIFFHNDGPLQGDFLIFYLLGAAIATAPATQLVKVTASRRSWRRAFAAT